MVSEMANATAAEPAEWFALQDTMLVFAAVAVLSNGWFLFLVAHTNYLRSRVAYVMLSGQCAIDFYTALVQLYERSASLATGQPLPPLVSCTGSGIAFATGLAASIMHYVLIANARFYTVRAAAVQMRSGAFTMRMYAVSYVAVWLTAVIAALLPTWVLSNSYILWPAQVICWWNLPASPLFIAAAVVLFTSIVMVFFAYANIFALIRKTSAALPANRASAEARNRLSDERKLTVKMMVYVVFFVICYVSPPCIVLGFRAHSCCSCVYADACVGSDAAVCVSSNNMRVCGLGQHC